MKNMENKQKKEKIQNVKEEKRERIIKINNSMFNNNTNINDRICRNIHIKTKSDEKSN